MIIHACAPTRIFNFGSWSDTTVTEHGAALNCAVSLYARVTVQASEHPGIYLRGWRDTDGGHNHDRPTSDLTLFDFLHEAARYFELPGLEVIVSADTPPGYGAGVSAAVRVAIVAALARLAEKRLNPQHLAVIAHRIQNEELSCLCGVQAYMSAAGGGIALYRLAPYPRVFAMRLPLQDDLLTALEQRLLIVRTGRRVMRNLDAVIARRCQSGERKVCEVLRQLRTLPTLALEALRQADWVALGYIMTEQTALQQQLIPALLTPEVRHISTLARRYGALASMINGAGGSVTILNEVESCLPLERELRLSGYAVLPVRVDLTGVRVWGTELSEFHLPARCSITDAA